MELNTDDQDICRKYLLGQLSEENQQVFEERLLTHDGTFEELLAGEDELIDQYLSGQLSNNEHQVFETRFLATPERQQKLQFARALRRYIKSEKSFQKKVETIPLWSSQSWIFRAAAALVVIAFLAAIVWYSRPFTSSPQSFAELNLTIGSSDRSEGTSFTGVKLLPTNTALRIKLELPEGRVPSQRYRVELVEAGSGARSVDVIEHDATSLTVTIPSANLQRREYALRVFATDAQGSEQRIPGSYYFKVE
jgi:hypothetical protein